MQKYLLVLLMTINFCAFAQKKDFPYVTIDRFCDCPEMTWVNNTGYQLKDIKKSVNDIEIRLSIVTDRFYAVEVITKKDTAYDAYLYYKTLTIGTFPDSLKKYGKWEKYPFRKYRIEQKDIRSIYLRLLGYHINSLPNQADLYRDGSLTPYLLQCKINNKFHEFSFGGQKELISKHPDTPEFKDYYNIVTTFDDLALDYLKNGMALTKSINP